ncbi:hypothetical protein H310_05891 [Aphanomyces invadans]|uniref:Myb-like domain-containing protein n=1 Tax=Aphanomyces invadans TaxID=157072 RepID=A0A024U912_9STRA|nr:hypothetical protein H310_05891 [Aphanomyces invadans]ETW02357.1 hypothetical protein H310_05891 [Aphanomyces invadans]|eukprot:XP_008868962.1 hypothetical protein H310_05891 [Aphanomyces invadans]
MDDAVLRALAANEAYVDALRRMVLSLEEEEARIQDCMHMLRRKRHRSQTNLIATHVRDFKRQVLGCETISPAACDDVSRKMKRVRASVDFKRGYFQTPCLTQVGGKLVDGVATPDEYIQARAVRELRAAVLPLQLPPPIVLTWTLNEQAFLTKDFAAWRNHHREPTNEEWDKICASAVATIGEKKRRWVRLKCIHHAWSPAEDAQLRELANKRGLPLDWNGIAQTLSSNTMVRFPVECMLRYQRECNPLCVGIEWDFRRWNAATHLTLHKLVDEHGEDWAAISERIAYRSANELKRKWQQLQATATEPSGVDWKSCATYRLLVLAAYCYSHQWIDVRWSDAMRHVSHPPSRLQQIVQMFQASLSPHGNLGPVDLS